jgi:WD40 repeat protein
MHVTTYHGHQDRVNVVKFHWNGNWLISGGKDAMCKLYELRMNRELQRFVGHTKDVTSIVWHPSQELYFTTGAAGCQTVSTTGCGCSPMRMNTMLLARLDVSKMHSDVLLLVR